MDFRYSKENIRNYDVLSRGWKSRDQKRLFSIKKKLFREKGGEFGRSYKTNEERTPRK